MANIHTGKMISALMEPKYLTKAKLARLLEVTQPTAALMLKSKSMQTDRLILVSEKMNYNFFKVIGRRLGIAEPGVTPTMDKDEQIKALTSEIEKLKEENKYLKKAIDLIGGRG
jgi:hypothetical protein